MSTAGGCERTIRTLVGNLDGVHDVRSDHRNNQVTVSYDGALVDDNAIRDALHGAGFPAT